MPNAIAWKQDSEGYFIEMDAGEKKDYSLDWSDYPGLVTLANVTWTLDANVTKLSQAENGKVTQVVLHATGNKGVWPCSLSWNEAAGAGVPKEVFPFRVVIR